MYKTNPKKNPKARRVRPIYKEGQLPKVTFDEKTGKRIYPPNPKGYNRAALKIELSRKRS